MVGNYRDRISSVLKKFLEDKVISDGAHSDETRKLIENILEFNLRGGKRVRPLLLIFGFKCFKGDDDTKIVGASIAMELMQAYFLIHDDIIDNADLRRGRPSMHKLCGLEDETLGKSIAILAGDICSSYVREPILGSDFPDSAKLKAMEWLNWTEQRTIYGEELDSLPGAVDKLTENEVMKIYELKTASYTIQGPLFVGAALASASDMEINQFREYGHKLGVAFQIQDDIIGIYGKVEETGKPNDSDIRECKKTLLIVKALEFCGGADREFLLKKYGLKDISDEDIEKIRNIIQDCGALKHCREKVKQLVVEGKESVAGLELRKEGKDFLIEIADDIRNMA